MVLINADLPQLGHHRFRTNPPSLAMDNVLSIDYAEKSDLGMRRANNQDSITSVIVKDCATWNQRGHLLVVADGMGAHAAGELASKLAVDNIPQAYYKQNHASPAVALRQAVNDANTVINNKGSEGVDFHGMGTTCTCLAILPQGALVAHVGDSRAYRLREGTFEQLSFDHSLIWEAAAAGQIPEENLESILPRNVITRSLGPHEKVKVDVEGPFDVQQGDRFLVCSDGLSGQVTDVEMGTILGCLSPAEAVQTLVDLANLRGGPDNITLGVAHIQDATNQNTPSAGSPVSLLNRVGRVPWFVWLVMLASLFILGSSPFDFSIPPLLFGLAAAGLGAALAIAVFHMLTPSPVAACTPLFGPFGNGPYRNFNCQPAMPVVETLTQLTGQLRNLADEGDWSVDIDWSNFENHKKQADAAVEKSDHRTAIEELCHAIRETMQQIRARNVSSTTESSINLN